MEAAVVCSAAMQIAAAVLCALLPTCAAFAQSADAGRRQYELLCSRCHGADGNGGEHGPGIVTRLFARDDEALSTLVRDGLPAAGMPGFPVADPDMRALVAFLRTLRPTRGSLPERRTVETTDGRTLQGLAPTRRPRICSCPTTSASTCCGRSATATGP